MKQFEHGTWQPQLAEEQQKGAIEALEAGEILIFPDLPFPAMEEMRPFLKEGALTLKDKTIKYNLNSDRLWGVEDNEATKPIKEAMRWYSKTTEGFVNTLFPQYKGNIRVGNTSFRPIEAKGRKQSPRHDDTRLHVDAFPKRPTNGERLLRVFFNINPDGQPRIWHKGEDFEAVAKRFLPQIMPPIPGSAQVMKALGLTKGLRSKYDHYMLNLHDKMKLDMSYQASVKHEVATLQPMTSWVVYSDQVSHAAISGRCMLEQTFFVAPRAMQHPEKSPLAILERLLQKKLV